MRARGGEIETRFIAQGRKLNIIRDVLSQAPRFDDYDAILTTEYTLAYAAGFRSWLSRSRTPVIVIGLNLSGSAIATGLSPVDRMIDAPFRRLALSVMHSRHEMALFREKHGLDPARMAFALWGFDLPRIESRRFEGAPPYVCLIGRNNRDFRTFCRAVEKAGAHGVIIAPSYAMLDFEIPKSVTVYRDLPMSDCLDCIRNASANLILVEDALRGAGHITAVAAMLLGVPQIYSDVPTLHDYLIDGATGWAVPLGDADAAAAAIHSIRTNQDEARRRAGAARAYAERWLSHEAVSARQADLVMSVVEGRAFEPADHEWRAAHDALARRASAGLTSAG
jgi:glycosyltransferase involved in cell wall biosynthesis